MTPKIGTAWHGDDGRYHVFLDDEEVYSCVDSFSRDLFVAVLRLKIKALFPSDEESPQDKIRHHLRQIEMICDEEGLDPFEWLVSDPVIDASKAEHTAST